MKRNEKLLHDGKQQMQKYQQRNIISLSSRFQKCLHSPVKIEGQKNMLEKC